MKKFLMFASATLLLTACTSQLLKEGKQDFDQQNYSAVMEKMLPLANKGNPQAEYAVGYLYYNGQGVDQDKVVGTAWIDKAAAQGLPQALKAQKAIQKQKQLNPLKNDATIADRV